MQALVKKEFNHRAELDQRNLGLNAAYDAIKSNDFRAFLALLREPYFDINQCASRGIQRTDGLTLHSDWTPMTYAIAFAKPEWVELFLLMGANPFGGHYNINPINLIDRKSKTPNSIKIAKLLWQHQYPNPIESDITPVVDNHKLLSSGPFIAAIITGDDKTVEKLLSNGVIYTDHCCHNVSNIASTLAVKSKSLSTVALLVQRGAIITEPATRQLLHAHSQEAWCQPIAALFALEKLKQIAIMELFCAAQGNLDLCRDAILQIRQQYQEKVDALKNGQPVNDEWQDFDAMKTQILGTVNPTPSVLSIVGSVDNSFSETQRPTDCLQAPEILNIAKTDCSDKDRTRSRGLAAGSRSLNNQQPLDISKKPNSSVTPSQSKDTLFSRAANGTATPLHNNQNSLKAGAFFLAAGTMITTISLGVLLKSPTFAIFVLPQVPMFFMSIAATIGFNAGCGNLYDGESLLSSQSRNHTATTRGNITFEYSG